jgi:hypothetical protein
MESGEDRRQKAYGDLVPAALPGRCAPRLGLDTSPATLGGDLPSRHARRPAPPTDGWDAVADDRDVGGVRPYASARVPLALEDGDVRDYGSDSWAAGSTEMLDDRSYGERPVAFDLHPCLERP